MKLKHKAPCAECPFRKNSVKGYLGPETVESIERAVHGESGWSCHMDLVNQPDINDNGGKDITNAAVCAGSLISANMSCKRYRDAEKQSWQKAVAQKSKDVLNCWEFKEYHGKKKKSLRNPNEKI